jgi:uncharacterized phosphosugar-binding protein
VLDAICTKYLLTLPGKTAVNFREIKVSALMRHKGCAIVAVVSMDCAHVSCGEARSHTIIVREGVAVVLEMEQDGAGATHV